MWSILNDGSVVEGKQHRELSVGGSCVVPWESDEEKKQLVREVMEEMSEAIGEIWTILYDMKYANHQSDDECLSYIASQLTSDESEAMKKLSKYSYSCHVCVSQEIINRMETSYKAKKCNVM